MRDLARLLHPKSIAVVGGGTWCENVITWCRKTGFDGEMLAVHPSRSQVAGCAAVRSVGGLPFVPDAVFLGVNRHLAAAITEELSQMGAGGAVCFASGFTEATQELEDGADLQQSLVAAAGHMPVLGPNCYGFINALDGVSLWPDQHGLVRVKRGVAIISQSSNIALNLTMQARGLPIAMLLTVGNQAQTGLSQLGLALLEDDRITAIGLHIEGIDDLNAFQHFAKKAKEAHKPLVILKVGSSRQAQEATVTHTASVAGSSAGASALFRRLGIAQVRTLPVLLETLRILHVHGPLEGNRLASMSCSGGEASLIADLAEDENVSFPPLTVQQAQELRSVLGPKVALANPLDYHTYIWDDAAAMSRTFAAMMSADTALGLVILDFPRADRCDPSAWLKVIDAVETASRRTGKPFGVLSSLPETLPEDIAEDLVARRIVPLMGMAEALAAISAASKIPEVCGVGDVLVPSPVRQPVTLSEPDAKSVLRSHGVRVPDGVVAASASEAGDRAAKIGFPVALKGLGFAHKTDAGAVVLNLGSRSDVAAAAHHIRADAFLVERMVPAAIAELLVGVVRDPAHGYVLTLAAGGVLTELLKDSRSLLLPSSRKEIVDSLDQLAVGRILRGYRGAKACDINAITDVVLAIQDFVEAHEVEEVEINPLMCGADFAIAADALIRMGGGYDG